MSKNKRKNNMTLKKCKVKADAGSSRVPLSARLSFLAFIICLAGFFFTKPFSLGKNDEECPSDFEDASSASSKEDIIQAAKRRIDKKTDERLSQLMKDVKTPQCAEKVLEAFEKYHESFTTEGAIPFEKDEYKSDCPGIKPDESTDLPVKDVEDIDIAFIMIVHENPHQVIRLINAVQHPKHSFVIHVDAKESSQSTFDELLAFAQRTSNVYVMEEDRVSVSWGGFNVVQATINAMKYVWVNEIPFDWLSNLSGYTYPLASIDIFRQGLATQSPSKSYMEIRPKPHEPNSRAWHHFVECDGKLHRITRLQKLKNTTMYVGSQWFTVARDFVEYIVHGRGFAGLYKQYAEHLVVADENYFQTVMKNSPMCHAHVNQNFHHIQFDEWEHSKTAPDPSKCLQPNPRHCGRSPTTMTVDYIPVLEKTSNLFARKFDERIDSEILDYLDEKLKVSNVEERYIEGATFSQVQLKQMHTENGQTHEKCLELPAKQTASAIMAECDVTNKGQIFEVGPCSSDGGLDFMSGQCMNSTAGNFGVPFCNIKAQNGFCLDLSGESKEAGGKLISYPCTSRWNQLFGFGTEERSCKVFMNIPKHYVLANPNSIQSELCLEAQPSSRSTLSTRPVPSQLQIFTAPCLDTDDQFQNFKVFQI
mmetsp:Transcript_40682/g.53574  ORF Transcript_40682/g.53574 Transcript_40682/m.53574 type:complete len:647 (-) Transcript_40682:215-2155(-)